MTARFRIKFDQNHKNGARLIPLNREAIRLLIGKIDHPVSLASDSWALGASSHYVPSNKFYDTQREYHGW